MSKPAPDANAAKPAGTAPVVVKKYANRRLYNTESSSYITLENLAEMVRKGRDFVVYDAKTGEDITRSVLTQIIVEEEGKGTALLPTGFLRQLIGFYGEEMQSLVPTYLEQAMTAFTRQQEQMRATVEKTVGALLPKGLPTGLPPLPPALEEVGKQNLAMMERAMSLFSPFYRPPADAAPPPAPAPAPAPSDELAALRGEIENLRRELAAAQEAGAKRPKPSPGG
jgi:polyhydroxyalkanoate synthesis repressor PhaR